MALATCAVVAACNSNSGGLGPWREEVQISDGRVILVERFEDSTVRKPIGDAGGAFLNETTLKVVAPTEVATTLPVLTTRYRPLILDFDPAIGTWFVIAFDERVCQDRIKKRERGEMDPTGRINLRPNFEYRLQQRAWVEVPVAPERIGLPVNLLIQRSVSRCRSRRSGGWIRIPGYLISIDGSSTESAAVDLVVTDRNGSILPVRRLLSER